MCMRESFHHPSDVFRKLAALQASGEGGALAIVTKVTGGAMRAPGAVMAIDALGQAYGYISNGCVDGDIIAQAQRASEPLILLYGEGSPFGDIVLPCGGAIEVLLLPNPDAPEISRISNALANRQTAPLGASLGGGFDVTYAPRLRLNIAGEGAAAAALQAQAIAAGFEIGDQSQSDKWTAWIILFHDHEKEPPILRKALASDAFYIGAMGSRKTHAARVAALKSGGVSDSQIARIHGPIGVIPSMRDANLLALSVLAQVVEQAQKFGRI